MSGSSKALLQRRLFSDTEFAKADRVDRIMMHLINPEYCQLNTKDEKYRDYMIDTFQVCCENYRQAVIIRLLKEMIPTFSHAAIVQLISDTQSVFGNITKRNHYFDLTIQRERVLAAMEFLQGKKKAVNPVTGDVQEYDPDPKDYDVLVKFEKLIFDIDCKLAELEPIHANQAQEMPRVTFSTDPSVLLTMSQALSHGEEE